MPLANPALTKFTTASPQLASFDWFDLASGTGYKVFYPMDTYVGELGTLEYSLITNPIFSAIGFETATDGATVLSFDLPIETTMTVEGDAIYQVPIALTGGDSPQTGTIIVSFFHVDSGDTETQLGDTVGHGITGNDGKQASFSGKTTLPRKTFSQGEIFRMKISVGANAAAGKKTTIFFDPKGRTNLLAGTAMFSGQSILNIPIPIN